MSRNSDGSCSPVKVAVLTAMAAERRIFDIGARSTFNYGRADIIVYDMPLDDPAPCGWLKDTVVKVAEALAMAQQQAITDPALPDGLKEALQQMLTQGSRVRQSIEGLSRDLDDALRNEAPIVMPAGAAPVSNTELF